MTIDIIGAGIGGLTTAIALEQKGIISRIFEQALQIKEVGAGIILANNAMQVYDKLGLRNIIEENGNIIRSTKKEQINTAEISDLKPTNIWYKENVCLIGDSAHATTPNMGQGACQAIEDAYVISECLYKYKMRTAFSEYQKLRLSKAHQIVKASWIVGKIAHLSNPMLIYMRNQILRLVPSHINRKQNERIFQLAEI